MHRLWLGRRGAGEWHTAVTWVTRSMTQMSSPPSSVKRQDAHVQGSTRPARLRAVLLGAVITSVAALTLGIGGALVLWHRAQPANDFTIDDQTSFQALAGRALTGARDIGGFVRHSAARDLSKVFGLLHRPEGEAALDAGPNMRVQSPAQPANTTTPTRERNFLGTLSDGTPRALATETTLPTAIPLPTEPSLQVVFDRHEVDVTPPLMQRVRLRTAFPPDPLSQATAQETGLVEVVVSVSGTVESAKFVTRPLNVHETMLLSAVKTWRFRPAMRHGHAVRYRLTIPMSSARI